MNQSDDFSPIIFVLGRNNTLISIMLEVLLEERQNRFGVESAGIEPCQSIDKGLSDFLKDYEPEEVRMESLQSTPVSVALNDHVKLVVYTSETVKRDGPIIATMGDKVTLDTSPYRKKLRETEDLGTYYDVFDRLEEKCLPKITESLGL